MSHLCAHTIITKRVAPPGLIDHSFANVNGIINDGLNISRDSLCIIDLSSTCICNDLSSIYVNYDLSDSCVCYDLYSISVVYDLSSS